MSVIVEFTIGSDEFLLGQILSGIPETHLELERIVPMEGDVFPFIWATGENFDEFERQVRANPAVGELIVLDRIGNNGLYRIIWEEHSDPFIEELENRGAAILQAEGNGEWTFRVRFSDHNALSSFYNFLTAHDYPIHIDRTYTLTEEGDGHEFDLTPEQREALLQPSSGGISIHRVK